MKSIIALTLAVFCLSMIFRALIADLRLLKLFTSMLSKQNTLSICHENNRTSLDHRMDEVASSNAVKALCFPLVDFGACAQHKKNPRPHRELRDDYEFSSNFAVMTAEILDSLDVFAENSVTADNLARFMINVLNADVFCLRVNCLNSPSGGADGSDL
ncbi:hypothetical protein WN51_11860 [Melipona quadrifasciata]|uniref:Uncharacterized protein n=1 Tax=Melipona quadrifasciata TaxID=166423 RepID=A0A0N0U6H5_9HYME|nr:hypothetical protein WN51_11860 [Melipona quadrifasciata]